MPDRAVVISRDAAITQRLAARLASYLRPGSTLCLEGDLGAGKTTFVRGLVESLHGTEVVVSPTFTLENRYPVRPRPGSSITEVVHVDLYRSPERLEEDLLPSILEARAAGAVIAVEWAGEIEAHLTPFLHVTFRLLSAAASSPPREVALTPVPSGWRPLADVREAWAEIERGAE